MRNQFKLLTLLVCLLIFGNITVYANGFNQDDQKIFDNADILSDSEEEELQKLVVSTAKELKVDIIIHTTDSTFGKTTERYSNEFYDDKGFGYEYKHGSGIMLVIDTDIENREVYIDTVGLANIYIDDDEIEKILDDIIGYVSSNQYYTLCKKFISVVKPCIIEGSKESNNKEWIDDWNNGVYDSDEKVEAFKEEHFDKKAFTYLKNPFICAIIALVVSGIIVAIMSTGRKTKCTVNSATYMDKSTFKLRVKADNFTHTTTKKTKINTESSGRGSRSSGGGSSHSSSRGVSHGGGGRKF